jgi:hypothetical protein
MIIFSLQEMKFIIPFVAVAAGATSHEGHDHSLLKPFGPFWGMTTYTTKNGDKTWNTNEIQLMFKENDTVDLKWWFGALIGGIDKQTFACEAVPFTFDEVKLQIVVSPKTSDCLTEVNQMFPKAFQLTDPFFMPVDHNNGNVTFVAAKGLIAVSMKPINEPINIPSGNNGLAPEVLPRTRVYADDTVVENPAAPKAADANTTTTTTTTKASHTAIAASAIAFIAALIM